MNQRVQQADAFDALGDVDVDSAHAAVVDYPWEFSIQNGTGRFEYRRLPGQGDGEGDRDIERGDAMFSMEADERFTELLDLLADAMVSGAWCIAFADDRFQEVVRSAFRDHDRWTFRRNWAWTPNSMGMGYYGRIDHYPIPVATLGETERHVTDRPTLYRAPGGRETEHPTGKPVSLYREMLTAPVIRPGERLLEPFCGAGPGAAVAAERGLSYWGADVDGDAVERTRARFGQERITRFATTDGGREREEAGGGSG